jgi:hypothetical protein
MRDGPGSSTQLELALVCLDLSRINKQVYDRLKWVETFAEEIILFGEQILSWIVIHAPAPLHPLIPS